MRRRNKWIIYTVVGFEIGFSVVAGLLVGGYIDRWLKTSIPYFTFLGLIGGVVAGVSILIRLLRLSHEKD